MKLLNLRKLLQPVKPLIHAIAFGGRCFDERNIRIDAARILLCLFNIKLYVRQKVCLVDDAQIGISEDGRVLDRLVIALGDADHHNPFRLAEIKQGRTDQVAHVFNKQHGVGLRCKLFDSAVDHDRIQMAAAAGVDLDDRDAGGIDALGIVHCLLIPLDHEKRDLLLERFNGLFEQGGFAGSGRTDKIQCDNVFCFKIATIAFSEPVVVCQYVLLQLDFTTLTVRVGVIVSLPMIVGMMVRMIVSLAVNMRMIVPVIVPLPVIVGMMVRMSMSVRMVMMSMVMMVMPVLMPVIMGLPELLVTAGPADGYHAIRVAASTSSTHRSAG